jgi:hypothetical protein
MRIHHLDSFYLFQYLYLLYHIISFYFAIYYCFIYLFSTEISIYQTYQCLLENYSNKLICILLFHANHCYHTAFFLGFSFMNWNFKTSLKIIYHQIILMGWFDYFIFGLFIRNQLSRLAYYCGNFYMLKAVCQSNFIEINLHFFITFRLFFVKTVN